MTSHAEALHALLRENAGSVATAESLTGGHLAGLLTAVPGASATYVGGVVTYATRLKVSLLGVPQEVVDGVGVVSAECAAAMATGVRALTGATLGLSTTGVAGPSEQEGRSVGTVYVGLADLEGVTTVALHLEGDRQAIVGAACRAALSTACERLRHTSTTGQIASAEEETPLR